MTKTISLKALIATAVVALSLVFVSTASAATISNPLFSNGQTSIDANGSASVSGTFTLTVPAGEVVEWLRTQSDGSQPFVDTTVGGQLGHQEQVYTNVPFTVKVPPNTGTYYPTVQGAGTYGGARSINGGDNVVLGATGLGTVRVVANGSSSGDVGTDGAPSWLAALMAAIANLNKPAPAPTVSAACAAYAQAKSGAVMGSTNTANVRLQGFLLSQGATIPALAAGAAFGFWGSQTEAARAIFVSANGCN